MDNIFEWCKQNKDALLAARAQGNSKARNIVNVHDMYVRYPDHAALAILEELVDDWQRDPAPPRAPETGG